MQDLPSILQNYACGAALLKANVLDTRKRRELVDVLADHLIVKYKRYVNF